MALPMRANRDAMSEARDRVARGETIHDHHRRRFFDSFFNGSETLRSSKGSGTVIDNFEIATSPGHGDPH